MTRQAQVLIVDDEEFIRKILSRIVSREGYGVGVATDGEEAMDELRNGKYDFVISDICMPNCDGMELARRIKAEYPDVRILLVTAYAGECDRAEAMEAGADCYITKPFKNTEIANSLATLGR